MKSTLFFCKEEEKQLEKEVVKGDQVLSQRRLAPGRLPRSWESGNLFALTQLWSVYCCRDPGEIQRVGLVKYTPRIPSFLGSPDTDPPDRVPNTQKARRQPFCRPAEFMDEPRGCGSSPRPTQPAPSPTMCPRSATVRSIVPLKMHLECTEGCKLGPK